MIVGGISKIKYHRMKKEFDLKADLEVINPVKVT